MENSELKEPTEAITPGQLLAAAREARGISQIEMADRLHWLPSYVGALEENRFEVLRAAAFARGYLRAYGKLVGVDEGELMAAYDALPSVGQSRRAPPRRITTNIPQMQKKGLAIPVGIAAAAILVLLLWLLQGDDEAIDETSTPDADLSAESADPVGADSPTAEAATVVENSVETATAVVALESSDTTGSIEADAAPDVQLASADTADTEAAEAGENLSFQFSGDCWLEVRNASAELIYANLQQAGNTLNISGEAPFDVLVGDARMVSLTFRGEEVSIRRRPGRVMARFSVGE